MIRAGSLAAVGLYHCRENENAELPAMRNVTIDFTGLDVVLAVTLLLRSGDLSAAQVKLLRQDHQVGELCPLLANFVSNFPASRNRSNRGRERKIRTDSTIAEDVAFNARYWVRRIREDGRKRRGSPPSMIAAQMMIDEGLTNIRTPEAVLNKITALQLDIDEIWFWHFVYENYGEQMFSDLVARLNPDFDASYKRLLASYKCIDEELHQAEALIAAHRGNLH